MKGGAPGRFKEPPLSPPVRRPKNPGRARQLVSKVIRARLEGLPSHLEDRQLRWGDGLGRSSIVQVYALTSSQCLSMRRLTCSRARSGRGRVTRDPRRRARLKRHPACRADRARRATDVGELGGPREVRPPLPKGRQPLGAVRLGRSSSGPCLRDAAPSGLLALCDQGRSS